MTAICVENYKNNEKVTHGVVLIKGRVKNFDQLRSEIKVSTNSQVQNYRLSKKGQFKALVELIPDENTIKFEYKNIFFELKLNYEVTSHVKRKIQPIYLLCRDSPRSSIEINCQKLLLGCKLAQSLYAEKLFQGTGVRKTFNLADFCEEFTLEIEETEAQTLSDQDLWQIVGKSLIESRKFDVFNTKFVAFCSFTKYLGLPKDAEYSYALIKSRTLSNPALSSGGLALLGTGCLYTWPKNVSEVIEHFLDKTRIDFTRELDDSNYRCTRGGCFSTTIGSLCHELGHIFDLGHTSDGIMGKDIDFVGRVFVTELHTEDLPDRIVGQKPQKLPKTEEKTRFTKINRTPGQFLIKYHEQKDDDLSFFAQNNLITLAFHKWFNNNGNEAQTIKFKNGIISSEFQLKLVELRKCADEMLIHFWNLTEKEVFEFKLPQEIEICEIILFVIDAEGNILKQKL
ncbi:uncharacterized protein LOC134835163 [Culicoides brevitarsis]|uniref:uncharacterized protein LOC134835163 n=1 Tax=Culicoides brevitarsis TaxID=469753 RepID=UPI00307CC051